MKTRLHLLLLVPFLFLTARVIGQSQTRKVLFLGNSYTYVNDLPQIVSQLASSAGDALITESNLIGGYTLQNHAANSTSTNKILSNNWDYIVLQEQSQLPTFPIPSKFMDGFSDLKNFIKQHKPCSQITSFMTWGYRDGDPQNCPSNPAVCTYAGMQNLLTERYKEMSDVYDAEVTPVGVVWKYIRENHPSINLYQTDGSHPSLEGSYLAACCFYTTLFRKNPILITTNYGIDATTATTIRNAVKTLVFDQLSTWYIGKHVPSSDFQFSIGKGTNEVQLMGNTPIYKDSFVWDFGDGSPLSKVLNPTHSYQANGSYTIRLTSYKCYLGQVNATVVEKPVRFCSHTHTISPSDTIICPNKTVVLSTQPADQYQWLDFFGEPIAGATNQSLKVSPGQYSVLTTLNGCTELSTQVLVDSWLDNPDCDAVGVKDIETSKEILLSPNPVENRLTIETKKNILHISIVDLEGKQMEVNRISTTTLDVSTLKTGVYLLIVETAEHDMFKLKFIKN